MSGRFQVFKSISATFLICDTSSCGSCYSYQDYAWTSCCVVSRSAGGWRNALLSELMRVKGQSLPYSGCYGNVWDSGSRRTHTFQCAQLYGALTSLHVNGHFVILISRCLRLIQTHLWADPVFKKKSSNASGLNLINNHITNNKS